MSHGRGRTRPAWPESVAMHSPPSVCQSRSVLSAAPLHTISPIGEKATQRMRPLWPRRSTHDPPSTHQSFTLFSVVVAWERMGSLKGLRQGWGVA